MLQPLVAYTIPIQQSTSWHSNIFLATVLMDADVMATLNKTLLLPKPGIKNKPVILYVFN